MTNVDKVAPSTRTTMVQFYDKVKLRVYPMVHVDDRELLWYKSADFKEFKKDRLSNAKLIETLGREDAEKLEQITSLGIEIQLHPQRRRLREVRRLDLWDFVILEQARQEEVREDNPQEIANLCAHTSKLSARDAQTDALVLQEEVKALWGETSCDEIVNVKELENFESPVSVLKIIDESNYCNKIGKPSILKLPPLSPALYSRIKNRPNRS